MRLGPIASESRSGEVGLDGLRLGRVLCLLYLREGIPSVCLAAIGILLEACRLCHLLEAEGKLVLLLLHYRIYGLLLVLLSILGHGLLVLLDGLEKVDQTRSRAFRRLARCWLF